MLKYIYIFKLKSRNLVHYRFNSLVGLFFNSLSIIITIMFWIVIYSNAESQLNGYSLNDMITYFVIGVLFKNFIFMQAGFDINLLIKDGGLSGVLLKPYSYSILNYFNLLVGALGNLIPQLGLTLLIIPLFFKYLSLSFIWYNILFLFIFIILGSISSYLIWTLLGYMAFKLEEASSVMWSFAVLLNFISGAFIPIDFFPKWIIKIISYLPTSTWINIPTKIVMNKFSFNELIILFSVNVFWIVILYITRKFLWNKGIKYYSSIGG